MGIQLDWEIEADQKQVQQAGEDPATRRRRRRARFRVLLLIGLVVMLFLATGALVAWRLQVVETELAQVLSDTVQAEVAALRIGDEDAYLDLQRSASESWLLTQQGAFDRYQYLMVESDIQLTGRVLDTEIDESRGRVLVEEIIDGVPYGRVWFYWRYDDGWRHVPPDYTFWGDEATLNGTHVNVAYREVDAALAKAIGAALDDWLVQGCDILGCAAIPSISVQIIASDTFTLDWSAQQPGLLLVPSPFVDAGRLDMPFDLGMQIRVANLLAEQLVTQVTAAQAPVYPRDAYYLRSSVVSWLVWRFTGISTNAFLIDSLAQHYGDAAVGQLLQVMQPDSDVDVLTQVTGAASLDQASLDWRDFLKWRLVLESELISRGDEANFLSLYDTGDETVRSIAYERYSAGPLRDQPVMVSVLPETGADGRPMLRALIEVTVNGETRQDAVLFRLVNGVWRRAS